MLETYLDGNLVNEPINLDEVKEHLYYYEELSAYLTEVDGNITFTGSEYDYIRNAFNNDVCASIDIRIFDPENNEIDFEGIINVADVQFIPPRKLAICEVQNNNITSRIDNNKSIECNLTAGKTKNDSTYTVTQQNNVTISNPTDSATITREGIRIFDAFSSIISFLTDNEIGFVSDYFDYNTNTDPQVYSVLMTGEELRTGNGNSPTISFFNLFNDLNALENLAMSFEDGNIRIENKDYYKNQDSSVSFDNVNLLSQQLATETLYAKVIFGSAQVSGDFTYLQDIRFNGMQPEEYHLGGQCNTDTELNLSCNKIITDTNIIQDVIPSSGGMGGTGNDAYDDQVLLIHLDSTNTTDLTLKPASATDYYFNERFTNRNVALRWLGQIPQSIYAFLGNGNDGCFINLTSDQINPTPYTEGLQCDQESPLPWNDVNGNYAIATKYFPGFPVPPFDITATNLMTAGFYTAPANAVYSFEVDAVVDFVNPNFTPSFFFQRMATNTIDGAREAIDDTAMTVTPLGGTVFRVFGGGSLYLNTGEYVGCSFIATSPPQKIYAGSTFKVFDPLGGVWQTYDAASVYNIENQLTKDISVQDWKSIKNEPYKAMNITYNDGSTRGWLKDISRNLKTGETEITLLGQNG